MTYRPRLAAALAVTVAALGATCPDGNQVVGPGNIIALSISPPNNAVAQGDSTQLTAVGTDSNNVLFIGLETEWTTSDAGIATVTDEGLVYGIAVGSATITAAAQGFTATATVMVQPQPAIALSTTTVTLNAIAGGADPGPDSVLITNAGGTTLDFLTVDSVVYGAGAAGWLTATLMGSSAPTSVVLTAQIAGLAPGSYSATVTIGSPEATNSPQNFTVTLVAGVDVADSVAATAGGGQSAVVNTAVPVAPTVHVIDQYGNNVPGVAVVFAVTGGGGSVTGGIDTTDAGGNAQVGSWTLGTVAGANSLSATVIGLTPVPFSATGTPGAPDGAQSSVAATGPIVACATACSTGGGTVSTVTVTARDQFGNPISGVAVTFVSSGSNNSLTQPPTPSDGAGQASGTVRSTMAESKNVTATVGGVAVTTPAVLVVNPDVADLGNSLLSAATATITACASSCVAGSTGSSVTATVRDQFGNPIPGESVTFAATGTANAFAPAGGTSNAAGTVTTLYTSTKAEAKTLSASIGAGQIAPTPAVTVDHAAADTLTANDGDNQSAGVTDAVTTPPSVLVSDAFGNVVPGVGVTFAVASGGGSITGANPTSDAAGVARVGSWTLGPTSGANTLNATATGLNTVTFNATASPGGADSMFLVQGDAQTDTVAQTLTVTYQVRVVDSLGNGVPSFPVSWAVPVGQGSINPPLGNTDVNGFATATRTLGTAVGPQTATAAVGGLAGSPVNFTATAVADAPAQIAATSTTLQSATVNTTVGVSPSVQVLDQFGNPTAGASVTFTVTGGGGSIDPVSPALLVTDGAGLASLNSWTLGTVAGANTVDATNGALSGSPVSFSATGTPDAVTAAQSGVTTNDNSIVACNVGCSLGGNTLATLTVTARDQYGNVVPGVSASLTVNGSSNAWNGIGGTTVNGTTDGLGQFSGDLTSTVAQLKTVSGVANGVGVTQTVGVTVNPGAPDAAFSSLVESHDPIAACQAACVVGTTASTLTVTARDAFNNAIGGAAVTISVTAGTNNYLNGVLQNSVSGSANGSGVYAATYNSGVAAGKSFNGQITSGTTINETTALTVDPAAASQVVMVTQPANWTSGTTVGSTQPAVRLRDPFGNNVLASGVTVTASLNSGTGGLSGTAGVATNASGIATYANLNITGQLTGTGNHQLRFTSAGLTQALANTINVLTSFSYNVGSIFANNGCNGCHTLTYVNIVNVASSCGPLYVVPFNAPASFIQHKVDYVPACGGGMPPVGIMPLATRNIIRNWINEGAANN